MIIRCVKAHWWFVRIIMLDAGNFVQKSPAPLYSLGMSSPIIIIYSYSWLGPQGRIQANAIDANASVRKKLPMHSSVRFLLQIMRNDTFCENTSLIVHISQQSYFFLEMSTKHISKFTSERVVLPKHITFTFPRCFKIYYSIILKMSFTFIHEIL